MLNYELYAQHNISLKVVDNIKIEMLTVKISNDGISFRNMFK